MRRRTGECVYCGRRRPITNDHIPPQSFCAKPKPDDLVTVPSCASCNGGASKDDEYFKTVLVLKDRAGDHPEAKAIRDSVFRSLAMPQKYRFRNRILRSVFQLPMSTPAGIYLGHRAAFDVDLPRIDRVAVRVVRGLYWHHHDRVRLPDDYHVRVWSESGLAGLPVAEARYLLERLVSPVMANPRHSIGRGALSYWFARADRPLVTGWILQFFGDVKFAGLTLPNAYMGSPVTRAREHAAGQ